MIDLARRLGVTHVTVARTIQRLQRDGLVTSLPYRSIFLTASGSKLSEESRTRHEIVVEFFEIVRRARARRAIRRRGDRASRERGNSARICEAPQAEETENAETLSSLQR